MKRGFADSATVTVTISQLPGQHVVGNPAARQCLPEAVSKRQQLDPLVQPADWSMPGAIGRPLPWSPFSVQQPLQPPQLFANLHAVNTPAGDMGSSAAAFVAHPQHLAPQQQQTLQQFSLHTPGLCSTQQAAPGLPPHITTQLSSSQISGLVADEAQPQLQLSALQEPQLSLLEVSRHEDATATATISLSTPAHKDKEVTQEHFLAELQAQLNLPLHTTTAQQQPGSSWAQQQPQQQPAPCEPLEELQLLLPAVHAEYKAEMQLMLRACQVASNITKHSTATGCTLLLDPASREQLQHQVLANCNEKHAVVVAAFKHAAQAVENAAAASGCSSLINKQQQQPGGAAAAAVAGSGAGAAAAGGGSMSEVWQALQQLRSSYQLELVAATSALFAICRGFGQRYALSPAASASIKAALAAAQCQHGRVEQLWQDIVLAAGGV